MVIQFAGAEKRLHGATGGDGGRTRKKFAPPQKATIDPMSSGSGRSCPAEGQAGPFVARPAILPSVRSEGRHPGARSAGPAAVGSVPCAPAAIQDRHEQQNKLKALYVTRLMGLLPDRFSCATGWPQRRSNGGAPSFEVLSTMSKTDPGAQMSDACLGSRGILQEQLVKCKSKNGGCVLYENERSGYIP
jgi:hypothetical protein